VVLHNKGCHTLSVRIPRWVDRKAIVCSVAGRKASPFWAGNFLAVTGLSGKESVTVEFPMVERTETSYLLTRDVGPRWREHTAELPQYVFHLRGSTCVKVEFPNRALFTQAEPLYPVFQRDKLRFGPAPMKRTVRYRAAKLVPW